MQGFRNFLQIWFSLIFHREKCSSVKLIHFGWISKELRSIFSEKIVWYIWSGKQFFENLGRGGISIWYPCSIIFKFWKNSLHFQKYSVEIIAAVAFIMEFGEITWFCFSYQRRCVAKSKNVLPQNSESLVIQQKRQNWKIVFL